MYGAILGDIIGSPYEFGENLKTKNFPLFSKESTYTDDSVMTVAVAEALLNCREKHTDGCKAKVVKSMQKWGRRYPNAGYGGTFFKWIFEDRPMPYGSWGNGSAMRVSSARWLYSSLDETIKTVVETASVTHNHPEGIKGAVATAAVIWMARNGWSKEKIKEAIEAEYYKLDKTCDEIRPEYSFDVSCQGSVPQAITAFLEGNDFEDVIRNAVSLGGDSDTITCIAGGMAEAMYGVPEELKEECRRRIEPDMLNVIERFEKEVHDHDKVCCNECHSVQT